MLRSALGERRSVFYAGDRFDDVEVEVLDGAHVIAGVAEAPHDTATLDAAGAPFDEIRHILPVSDAQLGKFDHVSARDGQEHLAGACVRKFILDEHPVASLTLRLAAAPLYFSLAKRAEPLGRLQRPSGAAELFE